MKDPTDYDRSLFDTLGKTMLEHCAKTPGETNAYDCALADLIAFALASVSERMGRDIALQSCMFMLGKGIAPDLLEQLRPFFDEVKARYPEVT